MIFFFFNRHKRSCKSFKGQKEWFYIYIIWTNGHSGLHNWKFNPKGMLTEENSLSCYNYFCFSNSFKNNTHNSEKTLLCVYIYSRIGIIFSLSTEELITVVVKKENNKKTPWNTQTCSTICWISVSVKHLCTYRIYYHRQKKGKAIQTKAYNGDLFSQDQAREIKGCGISMKIVK